MNKTGELMNNVVGIISGCKNAPGQTLMFDRSALTLLLHKRGKSCRAPRQEVQAHVRARATGIKEGRNVGI